MSSEFMVWEKPSNFRRKVYAIDVDSFYTGFACKANNGSTVLKPYVIFHPKIDEVFKETIPLEIQDKRIGEEIKFTKFFPYYEKEIRKLCQEETKNLKEYLKLSKELSL